MLSQISNKAHDCAQTILSEPDRWDRRVRLGFWVFGSVAAATLAFTTRHYVNGDAIAYLDMAEAFRRGLWSDAINLTYAPGYPLLLSLVQILIPVNPLHEIGLAKFFNFLCFLAAMGVCDFFVQELKAFGQAEGGTVGLPYPALTAICYSLFLFSSLVWVKIQLITPDILVFTFLLLCVVALMRIIRSPDRYGNFILLGLAAGLGYACKTFFFPFSAVLLGCAAAGCRSLSQGLPRLAAALVAMLLVAAPMLVSQSIRAGRPSFGEAGSYNYSYWVSGEGRAVHQPQIIHSDPEVRIYREGSVSTYPRGDDPAYWAMGIRPVFDLPLQLRALWLNFGHLVGRTALPITVIIIWFLIQLSRASLVRPRFLPPSLAWVLIVLGFVGTAMYCLVVMEIRYVAPFLFLEFVGFAALLRFDACTQVNQTRVVLEAFALTIFLSVNVCLSAVDQSFRALSGTREKVSHRTVFVESVSLGDFLKKFGIGKGDEVAIFWPPGGPIYWARVIGVRLTADITDAKDFLNLTAEKRLSVLKALQGAGIKALVAKGQAFAGLESEGWLKPQGTSNYYVYILDRSGHRAVKNTF